MINVCGSFATSATSTNIKQGENSIASNLFALISQPNKNEFIKSSLLFCVKIQKHEKFSSFGFRPPTTSPSLSFQSSVKLSSFCCLHRDVKNCSNLHMCSTSECLDVCASVCLRKRINIILPNKLRWTENISNSNHFPFLPSFRLTRSLPAT